MATLELLGFGSTGWGALLILAALMTLAVTATALAIGAVLGAIVAGAKLSGNPLLVSLGNVYTTVFRGVPELLIIYLIYFGGSSAVTSIGKAMGYEGFLGLPSFAAGALAVGIISGSYQAEVFRGAYLAIAKGELEAASAIGMHRGMRFRRIIIPQVLRFAIPGLGNVWQLSLKDSALISVTGLAELMRTSQVAAGSTRQYFLFFIAGGCLYLILTSLSDRIFNGAERRANRSMPASAMGQA
ncbi:octopine ABC transporter permease protein OccQ 2 (plasmid) [Rhizobium phaseoli]|uniref:Octopine ABC transporter, permease protein n=1 Tax=Rhizobium etli (strain CIAT 652) TaxID=491916 RepID=B3Q175_RHIE6|nr:ABC transporter permease subunit [Rhizobium phaseoli]ACE93431.1 octopine ABC transporter, permease protein [Rhizobium etli CIAT 652]KEC71190.1 octopine ABC transporter permease [Rhizobium leguminosarum bv. phaseoli CCGM1]MDH6648369.1 octopine/nopaline transport system permease protein [Rhizobium esperanzae]ANL30738.1 octopine ABC transporter permease protein OccQ 2 [Rhizobium phaseoli]MDK4727517.1 ABC transporter permease subunit [Rhizobium phaseoli]